MKAERRILPLLASSILIVLIACAGLRPTPIHDLMQNPRDYEGKSVTISGNVTDRSSLLVTQYFTLKDITGEIRVITDRTLPTVGTNLRVHGHVKQAFAFGSTDLVVFVEDSVEAQN